MEKKAVINKFIEYFENLLNEKDIEKQKIMAEEISRFSSDINDEVEQKYWDEPIEDIQKAALSMEHWKDKTGYCDVDEKDIRDFLRQLRDMLESLGH